MSEQMFTVRVEGDAAEVLAAMQKQIPVGMRRGLSRYIPRAHRAALENLSGSGEAGSYPVPLRTGHLHDSEDYILPGENKHGVAAGQNTGMLINTAVYVHKRHETNGPFMLDAIESTRDELPGDMAIEIWMVLQ